MWDFATNLLAINGIIILQNLQHWHANSHAVEKKPLTYQWYRIWSGGHNLCNHQHEDSQRKQNCDAWRPTQDTGESWVAKKEKKKEKALKRRKYMSKLSRTVYLVCCTWLLAIIIWITDTPRKTYSILLFFIFPLILLPLSFLPTTTSLLTLYKGSDWRFSNIVNRERLLEKHWSEISHCLLKRSEE